MRFLVVYLPLIFIVSCVQKKEKHRIKNNDLLFTKIDHNHSKVLFKNDVEEQLSFNFLNYPYIYNGGGVAVIDFNNDGLEDIYFTSNQNSNKLYLNKGNLVFEDVTHKANVRDNDGWTTGVTIVDINQDNWPDIYVCKSGELRNSNNRKNKLFVNQKNGTFKEDAERYGIAHQGFSTQAYFFDADVDGDLDLYLVNHRPDFRNNSHIETHAPTIVEMSDQLFINKNGTFENHTKQSGIQNSAWGLSAAIGDFNGDNYPDIYVANDFLQPDYLYINNQKGGFSEEAEKYFKHISSNSMGSDYADFNNDLLPDLIVLDMMASDHVRSKKNMATMSTKNFNDMVAAGYQHQYMANTLQLNRGEKTFSDVGQLAGISKTDWSWAPLIADFNNDGHKDIFVTNGIEKDLSNQDFRQQLQSNIQHKKKVTLEEAIGMMPSEKLHNHLFINKKDMTFIDGSIKSGLDEKINSNGAAYADLDNDGDLDLIINNQSDLAYIYKNNSQNNYLKIKLEGPKTNIHGIGAQLILFTSSGKQLQIQQPTRGFQSSVSHHVHFGIDNLKKIDSLQIIWPNKTLQTYYNPKINNTLVCTYKKTHKSKLNLNKKSAFESIPALEFGIDYKHYDSEFNDFKLQLLLPQKQSTQSKPIAIGDVNNDGLEDVFLGNGFGEAPQLYIQKNNGKFIQKKSDSFLNDSKYEDQDATFFDADNDGDLDLYVTSGGYELAEKAPLLQDRLYINNGKGNFSKGKLPKLLASTKSIAVADIDGDKDLDVFVGGRLVPGKYPVSPQSYLLENNSGTFAVKHISNDLKYFGMINESIFSDFDNDGDKDLILAAEWKPISIFENNNGEFSYVKNDTLEKAIGWFQTVKAFDYDADGDDDYFIGNFGLNNKFHPSDEKPLHIYADYLDSNNTFDIVLSKKSKGNLVPVRGKQCSTQQTPFLKNKIKTFDQFANASLEQIYGSEKLNKALHLEVNTFESFLLENKGSNNFKRIALPKVAQMGPTLDFTEINNELIGVGNCYEAEVETIRYDASKGFVLAFDNSSVTANHQRYFKNSKNTKAVKKITIQNEVYVIVFNNNNRLEFYRWDTKK